MFELCQRFRGFIRAENDVALTAPQARSCHYIVKKGSRQYVEPVIPEKRVMYLRRYN
jgi:hypothetical protein